MNYFTLYEVATHNQKTDLWVSILDKVYDITKLIEQNSQKKFIEPLIIFAGKDLSHWFDSSTGHVNTCIDPKSGQSISYCPHGIFYDDTKEPWWSTNEYLIGYLTKCSQPIRIINMLSGDENLFEICCEQTLGNILTKYSFYNSNWKNYTPVYNKKILDTDKTLEENGISDDRNWLISLGLPDTYYIPAILLYYNDDFNN